jgi:SAM-dependent MidA family methyltransferase
LPSIIIGNEFLDTFPVAQDVLADDGWCERQVTLDAAGRLAFGTGSLARTRMLAGGERPQLAEAAPGAILEFRRSLSLLDDIAALARHADVATVQIDYGHLAAAYGDTVQAVRNHRFEHPLTSPGEADLTAQVDFRDIGARTRSLGLAVDGPVTQAEFLGALGIAERTSRLMSENPQSASSLELAVARLMSPTGMGSRFKAIGLRSPALPPLPGFPLQRK